MPINLDGLSTQDKETIQKLRKVEEDRLKVYDAQVLELKLQNAALLELRKKAKALQDSLEALYNFDSPFEKKTVDSSVEGYIKGVANRNADYGKHQVDIKNLATKLRFASNDISPKKQIPATDITINDKTEHFPGGNLDDFNSFLNEKFSNAVSSTTVKKTADSSVMVVESKTEGKKGLLNIKDSEGVFRDLGLTGEGSSQPVTPAENQNDKGGPRENFKPVLFSLDKLSVVREGPTSIDSTQKSLTLGQNASRRLELPPDIPEGNKIKSITFEVNPIEKTVEKQTDNTPREVTGGPVDTINIKGISLNTYNITRERQVEQAPTEPTDFDFGVSLPSGSSMSLKNNGTLVTVPVSSIPAYIEFFTRNKEVKFSNVQLVFAADDEALRKQQGEAGKKAQEGEDKEAKEQRGKFPNLITPAKNAKLNIDGVDVEREKNEGVNDIIKGATLDFLKPTEGPIEISVNPNIQKSQEMVEDFIQKYNDLLDFTRSVSAGVKKNSEGKIEALSDEERQQTPLVTSSLVRSLIHGLQTRVSNAYPANLDPQIKIIQMIGVGTGRPNSNWSEISSMHLQFEDKELFAKMIAEHPQAVKEFFGQDKNGDRRFDDGMGFAIVEYLKAYTTQLKNGVIQSQVASNEDRMKYLTKTKKKKQEDIDEYERKLRSKFGHMEAVIQEQKSTGDSLRQRFGNNGNN